MSEQDAKQGEACKLPPHLAVGQNGESLVAARIATLGWSILARNWRPDEELAEPLPEARGVELDLVALDGETLVFVEVRSRSLVNSARASERLLPERLFSQAKQKRFMRAARCWLLCRDMWHYPCRFDLFCVGCTPHGQSAAKEALYTLEHYHNVLEATNALDSSNAAWQPW